MSALKRANCKPLLLVASPALQGLYSQTTLVAVPVGDKHLGFILNRATEVRLAALCELAKELETGYWHVADPDPELLFRRDTNDMWQELVERLGNGHAPERGRGLQSASL